MSETRDPTADLDLRPLTGAMGAEVFGIDITSSAGKVKQALYDYGALVIRNQSLNPAALVAFAQELGSLEVHPIVQGIDEHPEVIKMHKAAGDAATFGVGWHSDNSFTPRPSLASIVYAQTVPPVGGDTLFANQYLAWEQLSAGMQRMLDGLRAVHSAKYAYTAPTTKDKYEGKATIAYKHSDVIDAEVVHPVVRTHPETGRKAIYVNPMFTVRFEDMTEEESRPLLEFLFRHCVREDFQCRVRWQEGSVTLWDNRCVQHTALNDCHGYERILYRVTVRGEKPV